MLHYVRVDSLYSWLKHCGTTTALGSLNLEMPEKTAHAVSLFALDGLNNGLIGCQPLREVMRGETT